MHSPPIRAESSFGSPIPHLRIHAAAWTANRLQKLSFSATARRPQTKIFPKPTNHTETIFESPIPQRKPMRCLDGQPPPKIFLFSATARRCLANSKIEFARFLRFPCFARSSNSRQNQLWLTHIILACPSHPRKPRRRLDGQPPPKLSFSATARGKTINFPSPNSSFCLFFALG